MRTLSTEFLQGLFQDEKVFSISKTSTSVADDGTLKIIVKPDTKDICILFSFGGEGKVKLNSYLNPTYTGGTEYTPFNRVTGSTKTLKGTILIDPTVTDNGTQRGDEFEGATGFLTGAGGTISSGLGTKVSVGTELLFEIINQRGSAADLEVVGIVFEEE